MPATEGGDDGAVFVRSSLLTVRPKALTEINVDESRLSGDMRIGRIVLTLWIDRSGAVINVDVESADYDESTVDAIVDGFRRLRFSPGLVGETPVNSTMEVEVTYGSSFDSMK